MSVIAVIAPFLAIFVTISLFFLGKFFDVLNLPRNFLYFFKLSSYVRDLQDSTRDLKAREEDIDEIIVEAERQSRSPVNQVQGWKRDVAAIIPEISSFLDEYERRRNDRGFSFIRSNYSVGIRCADYLEKVKDLIKRGSFDVVTVESDSNYLIPVRYEVPGSMELKYNMALEFVQNVNSANVIGIWGMGGVGKTSFLKKMHNSFVRRLIFDHVIWIVASSEQSNVSKVQSEIVKNLRLTRSDDVQLQARIIHNFLSDKDFLLFIDDLWEAVDLLEVGVPDTNDIRCDKKRKVVFTTRQLYVCGNMEAKDTIKIECLNWEESWLLFKEKVGEDVINSHPDISELAKHVAKECKGLPLALITIGRAMSTKRCLHEWKLALTLMRTSQVQEVSGTIKHKMQQILKISYDFLDSEVFKKCFLSLSMWPEDYNIRHDEIVQCWMGLDILDNFESMEKAYQLGYSYIESLKAACLLEDGDELLFIPDQKTVKMHDVLRDLAIWIVSDCGKNENKWIIKAGIQLKGMSMIQVKLSEAECISLMHNDIKELPSDVPNCHNLLTLILRDNHLTRQSILNCFHNFRSLTYLDLSFNKLDSFPESICNLTELQYLDVSCNRIRDLPIELRNLKKLKYLMLSENFIKNVPRGVFLGLQKLLVLDMFDATIGRNTFVDFEELKSMEKKLLYFGITVQNEEELSELMLLSDLHLEALCLLDLQNISFHFMSIIRNSRWLKNLRIEKDSDDGKLWEIVFDKNEIHRDIPSPNLEILELNCLDYLRRILWRGIAPKELFVALQAIKIYSCKLLEEISWVIHLSSLKSLLLHGCESMRIAINNDVDIVDPQVLTFPSLEIFMLTYMENLEKVSIRSLAFPQLKRMHVYRCPKLKTLPLEVNKTPKLTRIEGEKEGWEKVEWEDYNSRSHFDQFFIDRYSRLS